MIRTILAACVLLCSLTINAEARLRHPVATGLHPLCNILWPCEPPSASSPQKVRETRGRYVARQMGIGAPVVHKHAEHIVKAAPSFGAPSSPIVSIGTGIVRSVTGATAHVAASATSAFQCFVDRLDAQGYPVRFLGGWRAHGSVPGSLHPAGLAMDVNQVARNRTTPPMPSNEVELANACGLISGRQWSGNPDSGHIQFGGWAGGSRHYAARHRHYASHRHRRYALR